MTRDGWPSFKMASVGIVRKSLYNVIFIKRGTAILFTWVYNKELEMHWISVTKNNH